MVRMARRLAQPSDVQGGGARSAAQGVESLLMEMRGMDPAAQRRVVFDVALPALARQALVYVQPHMDGISRAGRGTSRATFLVQGPPGT